MNNIGFRDRPLNTYEKSHWYCKRCGADLNMDTAHNHTCSDIKENKNNLNEGSFGQQNEFFDH